MRPTEEMYKSYRDFCASTRAMSPQEVNSCALQQLCGTDNHKITADMLQLMGNHAKKPKTNEEKLAAAKASLGKRWILHPEYQLDPRHTPAGQIVFRD